MTSADKISNCEGFLETDENFHLLLLVKKVRMTCEAGDDYSLNSGKRYDTTVNNHHQQTKRSSPARISVTFVFLCGVVLIMLPAAIAIDISFQYHHHDNLTAVMQELAATYPKLTRLYSIGKSEQGRDLDVLVVSKFPKERPLLVPAVKYIGNMHGNEPVGREMILHFANYLLENYGKVPEITKLLDKTQIHLLPTLNPDGFEMSSEGECTGVLGRYNARLIDLNRNFPDTERENDVPLATETRLVMAWLDAEPFVLSANFHGGALVASFAYDNYPGTSHEARYSIAPDDDVFRYLATTYAQNHPRMHTNNSCGDKFTNGITNGAEWFQQNGSMQDYNYEHNGVLEVTIELGCCKYPASEYLPGYWEENRLPLLRFLQQVHMGVKGIVYDLISKKPIAGASVQADGYQPETQTIDIPSGSGPVISNVYLKPKGFVARVKIAAIVRKVVVTAPVATGTAKRPVLASPSPEAFAAALKLIASTPKLNALFLAKHTRPKKSTAELSQTVASSRPGATSVHFTIKNGVAGNSGTASDFDDSFPFGKPTLSGQNSIITDNTRELLLKDGTPVGHYTAKTSRSDNLKVFWPQSTSRLTKII